MIPPFVKLYTYDQLKSFPLRCTSVDGVDLRFVSASGLEYWLHATGRVEVWARLFKAKRPVKVHSYDSLSVRESEYELLSLWDKE